MSAVAPALVSLTNTDQLVSLLVPTGWDVLAEDTSTMTIQGPPGEDGYRPTMKVEVARPERPGHEWFEEFVEGVVPELEAGVEGIEVVGTAHFALSSRNAEVFAVHTRLSPGPDPDLPPGTPPASQVQAWVWAGSFRMVVFSCSTSQAREETDVPLFEEIIASLRLLPARRAVGADEPAL
ncbi:hypothetical protein [Nocardioides sp.]|uniref:hypothetical protein n=1 Tax=Nocardioides sp. TaxID=35761 RepID=UPI00273379CF|nr:hypothetical protein [Nocardioides sp.]MDP3893027.1 hypothetical protein [Nocardioides sp.]